MQTGCTPTRLKPWINTMLKLSTYFRSTAAYRVRIALNIKGLKHTLIPVHLLRDGGEHKTPEFLNKNPDGLIPALDVDNRVLAQSMAIIEYLEETYPEKPLLPAESTLRAYIRGLTQTVSCDIHPLNNLRVLKFLVNEMGISEQQKALWYQHWIAEGFSSLETRLATNDHTGLCCVGDTPTMADCCLIPQVYNAIRFGCPLDNYPTIQRINTYCLSLDAFDTSRPENQFDAE